MNANYKVAVYRKVTRGYKKESEQKFDDWRDALKVQRELKKLFEGTERIVTMRAPLTWWG